jgi:sialidase-1
MKKYNTEIKKVQFRKLFSAFAFLMILLSPVWGQGHKTIRKDLWKQGTGLYRNYRIPSILVTRQGTLLAFCEGREAGDTGDIDILLKRSEDNGKTWSEESVVWNDDRNTCGNPCPVVDAETGRIWLFLTWNNGLDPESKIIAKTSIDTRKPYLCFSDNNGVTWSSPVNMEFELKDPSWGWYATGPGTGIQIRNGKYKGRLVIPANHSYDDPEGNIRNTPHGYGAHILFSDDHGKSWRMGQQIKPGCNESQVVELNDGTLVMNMRSYNKKFSRAVSFSTDGGKTWSAVQHDPQLVESVCQASILYAGTFRGKTIHLFSNPAVPSGRTHMTIKSSFDNCMSWSNSKLVCQGPSAYSCLALLKNSRIALFYECGEKGAYERLQFLSFPVKELFIQGTLTGK